jgi:hypothetical protein
MGAALYEALRLLALFVESWTGLQPVPEVEALVLAGIGLALILLVRRLLRPLMRRLQR